MEKIIEIKGLTHKYGAGQGLAVVALDDVNLTIEKGEFVAIIGPNGSGKSTLAKHFNALLLPTTGTVTVKGMDTEDAGQTWAIRRTAGMVFQNPDNQIVATMVEEDVAFGPENLGVPPSEIRQRVDEALQAVEMSYYREHSPHALSGGQKQRVAIAGVIAMRPECIILDEPTAMLDPTGREEVLATVKKLNKQEGITIVLITHFMEEAAEADRVIVMEQGRVLMEGTPYHVFARADELKAVGLDVPQVTDLGRRLAADGVDIPTTILTVEELVDVLCPLS
jgi:energy-coupling factor transport system ATP-binding protein